MQQIELLWNYSNEEFQELQNDINDFIGLHYKIIDVEIKSYSSDSCGEKYMAIIRYEEE